jgi:hypothetical protein
LEHKKLDYVKKNEKEFLEKAGKLSRSLQEYRFINDEHKTMIWCTSKRSRKLQRKMISVGKS